MTGKKHIVVSLVVFGESVDGMVFNGKTFLYEIAEGIAGQSVVGCEVMFQNRLSDT